MLVQPDSIKRGPAASIESFNVPKTAPSPPVKIEVEDVSAAAKPKSGAAGRLVSWLVDDLPKAFIRGGGKKTETSAVKSEEATSVKKEVQN